MVIEADKTRNFEASSSFPYTNYYLKHGATGAEKEVKMTLKADGVVITEIGSTTPITDYTTLKLYNAIGDNKDESISADEPISMGIEMIRKYSKSFKNNSSIAKITLYIN